MNREMPDFFINVVPDSSYPSPCCNYSPDEHYPEYPWESSDVSTEKNDVYGMIRSSLLGLKMDAGSFNTSKWNPFGGLITSGDTVVVKPNWVMHHNKNKRVNEHGMECMFTHPSVVRAVVDYCLIALKGTGRIIIGDAPMQGCDLDKLWEISGYNNLIEFYSQHASNVVFADFRHFSAIVDKNEVLTGKKFTNSHGVEVRMGNRSRLCQSDREDREYIVSDYNKSITNRYHHGGEHSYLINKEVLGADVVINLCKPKCHRLAGITGAVKNFVGITFDKACLPHRSGGSAHQGGDEYLYNSFIKKMIGKTLGQKIRFEELDKLRLSLVMRFLYGLLYYLMKTVSKEHFLMGSWYGNDTVWRMVLDLYQILLYADKKGNLSDNRQRRIFNIADMIIAGEGNGPVSPEPKKLGIILAGYDAVMMDRLICEIMGFDYSKIPSVCYSVNDPGLIKKNPDLYILWSNIADYNNKSIIELNFQSRWRFKPYDTWIGHIEKAFSNS